MNITKLSEKAYKWINLIQSLIVIIIAFIIFTCNFKIAIVPSLSMYPTLNIREFLFCEAGDDYNYEDIVLFHPSKYSNTYYVKRVIGLPGDKIEVKNGSLFRNNEEVVVNYTNEDYIVYTMPELVIPEGEYFMLGDNRNNSGDSHVIGTIPTEQCVAKVLFHYIPTFWDVEH